MICLIAAIILGLGTLYQSFRENLKDTYYLSAAMRRSWNHTVNTEGKHTIDDGDLKNDYCWRHSSGAESLVSRFAEPAGYRRVFSPAGSFGHWLRNSPLKPGNPSVFLYDGTLKQYQYGHAAVVDIDVGDKDLQQCADAIIRLRAEYFYSRGSNDSILFRITNGDMIKYRKWINGYRPRVINDRVNWQKQTATDSSYSNFRKYLDFIFNYAGTFSLQQQMKPVDDINGMQIGDIFIQGGFPGHAVLIMDIAENLTTGEKIFLLGQSYMPAQDFHILKNLNDPVLSPWYRVSSDSILYTPEWTFTYRDLRRF